MKFYPTYLQSFGLLLIFFLCSILSVLVVIPFFSFDSGIAMSIMYVLSTSLTIGAALVIRKDYSFLLNRFSPVIVLIASVTLLSIHLFLDPLTNLIPLSDTLKKMLLETIRQPAVFFFYDRNSCTHFGGTAISRSYFRWSTKKLPTPSCHSF